MPQIGQWIESLPSTLFLFQCFALGLCSLFGIHHFLELFPLETLVHLFGARWSIQIFFLILALISPVALFQAFLTLHCSSCFQTVMHMHHGMNNAVLLIHVWNYLHWDAEFNSSLYAWRMQYDNKTNVRRTIGVTSAKLFRCVSITKSKRLISWL